MTCDSKRTFQIQHYANLRRALSGIISTIEQVNSAPNPVASDPHRKGNNPPLLRYLFSM